MMSGSIKAKEWCQDCGRVFLGGKKAFLCPICRKRRVEEGKRKYRERGVKNDKAHENVCDGIQERGESE